MKSAFRWELSCKRLGLAQHLGRLGVSLTCKSDVLIFSRMHGLCMVVLKADLAAPAPGAAAQERSTGLSCAALRRQLARPLARRHSAFQQLQPSHGGSRSFCRLTGGHAAAAVSRGSRSCSRLTVGHAAAAVSWRATQPQPSRCGRAPAAQKPNCSEAKLPLKLLVVRLLVRRILEFGRMAASEIEVPKMLVDLV
jgi:hypothetical protein